MKKLLFIVIALFLSFFLKAQNVALGEWKDYLSYNSPTYIAEENNKIYCVSNGGLFYINKIDKTINRLSKVNGLSDVNIKQLAHCYESNTTIIVYENCNIDLLKNDYIVNLPDIKRKAVSGIKKINNTTVNKKFAYLSSSLGVVVVDLEKSEIKETYNVAEQNENVTINGCAFLEDSIFAATNKGLYVANTNSPNLADFNNWQLHDSSYVFYDNILAANGTLFIDTSSQLTSISFNNNTLVQTFSDSLLINNTTFLTHSKFENLKHAWLDNDNILWVADSVNGLLKFNNSVYQETYIPEGPVRNDIYSLEYEENKLYMCHGGHANFSTNSLINDGVSIKNIYDDWINYDRYKLGNARDILEVAVNNGAEYYASWYHGIPEMRDGELVTKYGFANTNGALDTCWYSNNRIRISDIKFDSRGNMWALSSEVNHPVVVKSNNNSWYSFSINQNQVGLFLDDLLIDRYDQKWGC